MNASKVKKKKKKLNSKTINRADCLGEKSAVHRFFSANGEILVERKYFKT